MQLFMNPVVAGNWHALIYSHIIQPSFVRMTPVHLTLGCLIRPAASCRQQIMLLVHMLFRLFVACFVYDLHSCAAGAVFYQRPGLHNHPTSLAEGLAGRTSVTGEPRSTLRFALQASDEQCAISVISK